MIKEYASILSVGVVLCCSVGMASAMTLVDAYQLALAKDAKLASSQNKLLADQEMTEQAKAQLLPQVSASLSSKQEAYQTPRDPRKFDERTTNRNVQVTQSLFNRQAWLALDQAGLKVDYAKLRLLSASNELGVRVAQAYLTVLMAQENLNLSEQQVQTTRQRLEQVTAALKVGYSTKVDKLSLMAELDDAMARLTSDQQQLVFFRERLKGIIGQKVPEQLPWPSVDAQQLLGQFVQAKDWLQQAEQGNLEVRLQQKAIEVAQQEIEVRKSAFYPTVNLGAYYADADGATYFAQKNDNRAVYVEMRVPLYQGGYDQSRVRESRALLRSAEFDAQYAKIDAQQRAQEQVSALRSSKEKNEALFQAIQSGEAYLASAEEGYRLGVRDIAEVLRAKEKLLTNRREQIKTQLEMINALVLLYAVVGELEEPIMQQISKQLWLGKN